MELTIDKNSKVFESCSLDTELGGYIYRSVQVGNTPEEALAKFWDDDMEDVPLDIVKPEIIAMRRLHNSTVGLAMRNPHLAWHWEIECAIIGEADWPTYHDELDPASDTFWTWVEKYGHRVHDKRVKPGVAARG